MGGQSGHDAHWRVPVAVKFLACALSCERALMSCVLFLQFGSELSGSWFWDCFIICDVMICGHDLLGLSAYL